VPQARYLIDLGSLIDQSNRVVETDAMRAFILACLLNDTSYLITLTKLGLFSPLAIQKAEKGISHSLSMLLTKSSIHEAFRLTSQSLDSRLSSRLRSSRSTTQHWRQLAFHSPLDRISVADSCRYPTDRHAIPKPPQTAVASNA
jgi:hypothetical protein